MRVGQAFRQLPHSCTEVDIGFPCLAFSVRLAWIVGSPAISGVRNYFTALPVQSDLLNPRLLNNTHPPLNSRMVANRAQSFCASLLRIERARPWYHRLPEFERSGITGVPIRIGELANHAVQSDLDAEFAKIRFPLDLLRRCRRDRFPRSPAV